MWFTQFHKAPIVNGSFFCFNPTNFWGCWGWFWGHWNPQKSPVSRPTKRISSECHKPTEADFLPHGCTHWKCHQAEERFRCLWSQSFLAVQSSWVFLCCALAMHKDRIIWSFSLHWKLLWKPHLNQVHESSFPSLCFAFTFAFRCFLLFHVPSRPFLWCHASCGCRVFWISQAHLCAGSLVALLRNGCVNPY